MLAQAVAEGRAPDARPADGARPPRGRVRGRLPLRDAGLRRLDRHGHGPEPPPDPVDELVPPRRGPLRGVRDELPRVPGLRLQALAHGHDLQHELRAPVARDADGVRDARRRRRPHGGHDLPDVPRPPPPRDGRGDGAHADRLDRLPPGRARPAGVLLRRPVRLAPDGLPLPARAAGDPRPAQRLRRRLPGRARPVRLPPALPARQRHALPPPRPRRAGDLAGRRRPAARAGHAGRRRRGRVPRGPRRDRLLGPLAVPGGGRDRPVRGVRRLRRAARRRGARRATRRSPCARARARRRCTCSTGTAARR